MVGGSNPPIPTINLASNSAPDGVSPTKNQGFVNGLFTKTFTKTFTKSSENPLESLQELFELQKLQCWSDNKTARELGISSAYFSLLKQGKRSLKTSLIEKAASIVLNYSRKPLPSVNYGAPFVALYSVGTNNGLKLKKQIDEFLLAKQVEGKSQDTLDFYRDNLGRFLWWLKHTNIRLDLKSIDVNTIRSFLAYVQTATNRWGIGSKSSEHKASMSTVDAYWRTLQSLYTWLVRENVIDIKNNPIKRIPRPRVLQKVVRDIPLELISNALSKFGRKTFLGARNCAILLMLLDTGIRLSECAGIKLADINMESGLIRIMGKGGVERLVRIGKTALDGLKVYLDKRRQDDVHQLWINKDGRPFGKSGLQIMIRRLSKLGGNVRWSPHTFRNTFAINFLRDGGDPFTLQILGGWTDLEMPRHYTAALKAEDAFRVHVKASPADALSRQTPRKYNGTKRKRSGNH